MLAITNGSWTSGIYQEKYARSLILALRYNVEKQFAEFKMSTKNWKRRKHVTHPNRLGLGI
jgi:hypothetical protein